MHVQCVPLELSEQEVAVILFQVRVFSSYYNAIAPNCVSFAIAHRHASTTSKHVACAQRGAEATGVISHR